MSSDVKKEAHRPIHIPVQDPLPEHAARRIYPQQVVNAGWVDWVFDHWRLILLSVLIVIGMLIR